jgi:hypothetical protein
VLPKGGCSPPWKKFFWNKYQRGTKVKFTLDFLRNLRENLKGGTKGYFDFSREKSCIELNLEMFPLVPPLRFQYNFGKNL